MIIKGLQKTTLLDFPEKLACVVFTGGCNFRCPFCHNASLVLHPNDAGEISEDEFFSYISKRKNMLDGVCITGGEPLLCPGIEEFMQKIKNEGLAVKLDTNGTFPKKLKSIIDNNLVDYVAMDIKNSKEKYALTAGVDKFPTEIEESINIIMNSAPDYEFRTTVVKEMHTKEDLIDIAHWIKGTKKYFLQSYVDSGDTIKPGFSAYSPQEMLDMLKDVKKILPVASLRGI